MGGITIIPHEAEQVLVGEHLGVKIVVISVKPSKEAARVCWEASCGLLETFMESDMWDDSPALIIDIAKATVRHGYITEMEEKDEH